MVMYLEQKEDTLKKIFTFSSYRISNISFEDGWRLYDLVLHLYERNMSPAKVLNIVGSKVRKSEIPIVLDLREFCLLKNRMRRCGLLSNGRLK